MKKVLLMFSFLVSGYAVSQGTSCATATPLTTTGTYTVLSTAGTYVAPGTCLGGSTPAPTGSAWYSITPTQSGAITISSNLPTNDGTLKRDETRLSVLTGTCGLPMTCVIGNDDVSSSNYLSAVTFNVTAGTTYYVQWDNGWLSPAQALLPFDFSYSFVSCAPVSNLSISTITANSATLTWTAPTPAPSSYDIEYGAIGFTQGTGTSVSVTSPSYTFTSPPAGTNISFYIRTNCGLGSLGTWMGPYNIFLPVTTPYSNNFDATGNSTDGFAGTTGWAIYNTLATNPGQEAHSPTAFYFTYNNTTASNQQLYTRPLMLAGGNNYDGSFFSKLYAFSASGTVPLDLKVYYNTTRSLTGATLITTLNTSTTTYAQKNFSFTVPTSGMYYLIFSNENVGSPVSTGLLFDTFSLTGIGLGTSEVNLSNSLSIFPNPVSDILNIKTKEKVQSASIFDMTGRKIEARVMDNKVDVTNLERGTYIINIQTANGTTSEKFIKI